MPLFRGHCERQRPKDNSPSLRKGWPEAGVGAPAVAVRPLRVTTIAAILIAATLTVSAQGEWKWAHCIGGGTGSGTSLADYYNKINTTAFDSDGNLYVYGMMGGTAKLDGVLLNFSENANVLLTNNPSILLAKFDTLGNMLWYKVVKQSTERSLPKWMEVRGDRIYIAGDCGFNQGWLYYMDTLITESQITSLPDSLQKPPFKKYTYWTFFATLDLDGNLLEDHFVEAFSREYLEPVHHRKNHALCRDSFTEPAPLHVDHEGNWYIFTPFSYQGVESDPFTIVVYGDSNRVYDLYLPGNIDPETPLSVGFFNAMLYKFSPDWELVSAKLIVDHTEGMTSIWPNGGDSIKCHVCYFKGLSFDEEDNMYISGHMQMNPCYSYAGGLEHHYPIYLYWDSVHRLVVHDITSAEYANFIVKYDTAGNVVWCNQLHTKGYVINVQNGVCSTRNEWGGNTLSGNSIYIAGNGAYFIDDTTLVYFDDESNPLQRYTEDPQGEGLTGTTNIGFFVRYDINTGAYISHGIVPAAQVKSALKPGVIHNRVFTFAKYGYDTEPTNLFVEWRDDGTVIKTDTVEGTFSDPYKSFGTTANERGYVVTALLTNGPLHFSDAVATDCHNGSQGSAVLAMYHDPAFAEPYVGIPEREEVSQSVKVWPNPARDEVTVMGIAPEEVAEVAVLTMQGRQVANYRNVYRFNVSRLATASYIVRVVTTEGKVHYLKLVKQ